MQSHESKRCGRFIEHRVLRKKIFAYLRKFQRLWNVLRMWHILQYLVYFEKKMLFSYDFNKNVPAKNRKDRLRQMNLIISIIFFY